MQLVNLYLGRFYFCIHSLLLIQTLPDQSILGNHGYAVSVSKHARQLF